MGMDRSTLKQELEKVIGDSIETMNSKVQDGEENFEGDKNDIFPVALMRQEERARQRKMKIFLNGVGVAEIVMGVLALILNTIFIYDGMNSGWYEDPEGEGNGMKVVSIGEGIIAGVFYILLAAVTLGLLAKSESKKALLVMHILLILISFTLIVTNACQLGLIHQYARNFNPKDTKWYGEEPRQTSVVAVELVANFLVFILSTLSSLVVPLVL